MGINSLSAGSRFPYEVNAVIEISADSDPVKYEFDEKNGCMRVNRFMPVAMHYPCNYGFVPATKAGDGDPLDILVVSRYPIMTGAVITVRPVGVLYMSDEGGEDVKVVSVPISKVDYSYDSVRNHSDLPQQLLDRIFHFFAYYKKLEKDKHVTLRSWGGYDEVIALMKPMAV